MEPGRRLKSVMKILGLPDLEEHTKEKRGERVVEGRRRAYVARRDRALRRFLKRLRMKAAGESWTEHQFPGELGRFKHTRNEMKRRFRQKLSRMAYLRWGLIEPRLGTGHKVAGYELWALRMNFIAQGWDPSTGHIDESGVPPGRWDLDESEWLQMWKGWPQDIRKEWRIQRVNDSPHFTLSDITITPRKGG